MAYVTIPKDLTKVKSKVLFGLTKRQLICFGAAALIGVPLFFLLRRTASNSAAAFCMIIVMLPFFLLAMYHLSGTAGFRNGGAEPGLGGMAHGLPERMDGRILWTAEPEGIPRMTERMDDRALRLKTLGNAVCPPQAYPIFRYIAMIENGTCGDFCPYGKEGDCL